jgi:antibiotic biosynthesis monooxygenase (ABM) superfamily enzyme
MPGAAQMGLNNLFSPNNIPAINQQVRKLSFSLSVVVLISYFVLPFFPPFSLFLVVVDVRHQ